MQCVVTSPPYFGLRNYGIAAQIGLESTPDDYVSALVGAITEGMSRAFPVIKADDLRALISQWRVIADGQSLLLSMAMEKCAGDVERLLQ